MEAHWVLLGGFGPVSMRAIIGGCLAAIAMMASAAAQTPASSDTSLKDSLDQLLQHHRRIVAARKDVAAAREQAKVALGGWYPTLDVTSSYGYEKQNKFNNPPDTSMPPRQFDLTLTQRLWDFGATSATIRKARLALEQAKAKLEATRQAVLREAVTAYLNVLRQSRILAFAKGSVANIKHQAKLETARVERGSGLGTDVLQAKTQLAGAEAKRTQAEGAFRRALNRYQYVFGALPADPSRLKDLPVPTAELPKSVDDAIDIAHKKNPQLEAAHLGVEIAKEEVKRTRASELYPSIDAVAEQNNRNNYDGTIGLQQDTLFKVQLSYSLNARLTAINTLKASRDTHDATYQRFIDARDKVEEQVRNAWDGLATARDNASQLENQANIAAEFLRLARRERQLGNRSLIDVLAGETSLINAQSQAASAKFDVSVAAYDLLAAMGRLTPDIVVSAAGTAQRVADAAETDVSDGTSKNLKIDIDSTIKE